MKMAKYKVSGLTLARLGETDDVIVSGLVNDKPYETHVWYSHLYGKHSDECLKGDTKAITSYCQHQLIDLYKADPTNVETIKL